MEWIINRIDNIIAMLEDVLAEVYNRGIRTEDYQKLFEAVESALAGARNAMDILLEEEGAERD